MSVARKAIDLIASPAAAMRSTDWREFSIEASIWNAMSDVAVSCWTTAVRMATATAVMASIVLAASAMSSTV